GYGGREVIEIESPFTIACDKWDQLRYRSNKTHAVDHAGVGRICQNHLIAGIGSSQQSIEHPFSSAASYYYLLRVVSMTSLFIDVIRDGHTKLHSACEWQITVGF